MSGTQLDRGWFGQPRGLSTLFFTEMWSASAFTGLRALLILYMTAAAAKGGLGFSTEHAASIYGWYTFGVYAARHSRGIIADRWLGQFRSVLWGGVIIALGHFSLAYPSLPTFYLGLTLIVIGTGLLKPNISHDGRLAVRSGRCAARRPASRSSTWASTSAPSSRRSSSGRSASAWTGNVGFGCAGIGMTLGLIQ